MIVGELIIDFDKMRNKARNHVKKSGVTEPGYLNMKTNSYIGVELEDVLKRMPNVKITLEFRNREPNDGIKYFCHKIIRRVKR